MVKTVHGKKSINTAPDEHKSNNSTWSTMNDIRTDGMRKSHTGRGEKKRFQHEYFWSWGYALCQSSEIKIWSIHKYHSTVRSRCIIYVDNTIIYINYNTIRIRQRNTMIISSTAGYSYNSNDIILYYKWTLSLAPRVINYKKLPLQVYAIYQ